MSIFTKLRDFVDVKGPVEGHDAYDQTALQQHFEKLVQSIDEDDCSDGFGLEPIAQISPLGVDERIPASGTKRSFFPEHTDAPANPEDNVPPFLRQRRQGGIPIDDIEPDDLQSTQSQSVFATWWQKQAEEINENQSSALIDGFVRAHTGLKGDNEGWLDISIGSNTPVIGRLIQKDKDSLSVLTRPRNRATQSFQGIQGEVLPELKVVAAQAAIHVARQVRKGNRKFEVLQIDSANETFVQFFHEELQKQNQKHNLNITIRNAAELGLARQANVAAVAAPQASQSSSPAFVPANPTPVMQEPVQVSRAIADTSPKPSLQTEAHAFQGPPVQQPTSLQEELDTLYQDGPPLEEWTFEQDVHTPTKIIDDYAAYGSLSPTASNLEGVHTAHRVSTQPVVAPLTLHQSPPAHRNGHQRRGPVQELSL